MDPRLTSDSVAVHPATPVRPPGPRPSWRPVPQRPMPAGVLRRAVSAVHIFASVRQPQHGQCKLRRGQQAVPSVIRVRRSRQLSGWRVYDDVQRWLRIRRDVPDLPTDDGRHQ